MSDKKILDNIKKLREITGVGFSDCKLAITETNGDIEKSIEYLRKKGIAKASKKMSRVAADGLILVNEKDGNISIIEINSETDFVAKTQLYIDLGTSLANSAINFNTLDSFLASDFNGMTVSEKLIEQTGVIGEKIEIGGFVYTDCINKHTVLYQI